MGILFEGAYRLFDGDLLRRVYVFFGLEIVGIIGFGRKGNLMFCLFGIFRRFFVYFLF